ncbi:MAG: chemotaxis protein [Thiomonas delicata]|jgi:capsule polysaccharide export protein KpsE/RkpR
MRPTIVHPAPAMPASWLAAINAALPYIDSIAKIALPAFGQRKSSREANEDTHRQLAELQTAVTHNAEHVRELAVQLQAALSALEQAAAEAAAAQRRLRLLVMAALALAGVAIALALALWLRMAG